MIGMYVLVLCCMREVDHIISSRRSWHPLPRSQGVCLCGMVTMMMTMEVERKSSMKEEEEEGNEKLARGGGEDGFGTYPYARDVVTCG